MGEKTGLKKGAWTREEDERLSAYMNTGEFSTWSKLPKSAGLNRCGKSCRLRWRNHLRPDLKSEGFTREEEELILNMHDKFGNRWSKMAASLPGRSDNQIKNYFHTHLKKKSTKRTKPKKAESLPKPSRQDSVPNSFLILESSSIVGSVSLPKSQGSSPVVGNEDAIMEDHGPHEMYSEADAIPKFYDENEISSKPDSECEHNDCNISVWDFPVSPQTSDDFSMEDLATDEVTIIIMEYLAIGKTAISSELSQEPGSYYWNGKLMIDEEVPVVESMDTSQLATPSDPILEDDPDRWNEFSLLYQSLGFTSGTV